MCCPLDQEHGRLVVEKVKIFPDKVYIKGCYDRTPETHADRMFRFFQRLELIEKIAEIADESFHFFGTTLRDYATASFYQLCKDMHNAAHDIEHLLHAVCFIGDLSRVFTGKFFEYHDQERKNLDYIRSAARVCHTAAHFLATILFLHEREFIKVGRFEQIQKFMPMVSAAGYAIWTASLVWRRYQGEINDRFASDLGIHLGGFIFEAIPLAKQASDLNAYAYIFNKIAAAAGIIHAACVVDRLMPPDTIEVHDTFKSDKVLDAAEHSSEHEHCDHCHDHALALQE